MGKKGKLSSLVSNGKLINTFLEYFQNGGVHGSNNNNSMHLSKFSGIAPAYFLENPLYQEQQRNVKLFSNIETLILYLHRAVQKTKRCRSASNGGKKRTSAQRHRNYSTLKIGTNFA